MQGNWVIRSKEHRDDAGTNVRRILAQRRKEETCRNTKDNKRLKYQRTEGPSPSVVYRKATSAWTSHEPHPAHNELHGDEVAALFEFSAVQRRQSCGAIR